MMEVETECTASRDIFKLIVSTLLLMGILISYIPQRKSSIGLSPYYLFLGTSASVGNIFNVVLLQLPQLQCCAHQDFLECYENIVSMIQLILQGFMLLIILLLFLIYYPIEMQSSRDYKHGLISAGILFAQSIAFIITSMVLYYNSERSVLVSWATALGFFSLLFSLLQYLPQIHLTFVKSEIGALSIPTMLIQTPGSFVFVYTLASSPGTNVSTWITYLVTGVLQGILLIICIVYHFRDARKNKFIVIEEDQQNLLESDAEE